MNPLANMFGREPAQVMTQNNPIEILRRFRQFRNNFQGDPKQAVMNLLSSGRMSQDQFNQLSQMAQIFKNEMLL